MNSAWKYQIFTAIFIIVCLNSPSIVNAQGFAGFTPMNLEFVSPVGSVDTFQMLLEYPDTLSSPQFLCPLGVIVQYLYGGDDFRERIADEHLQVTVAHDSIACWNGLADGVTVHFGS